MTEMTQVLTQLLAIQPQLERARPLLEACPEVIENREHPGEISGALEITGACFRYSPEGPLILDRVSLKAAPGEMIAIVGPSGSGKSTLMRLLLDDATSALDNRVQAVVTESLDRLSVTRVVVAHRLGTVMNADRIDVLVDGCLVETGSYAELIAADGVFADLSRRQMV